MRICKSFSTTTGLSQLYLSGEIMEKSLDEIKEFFRDDKFLHHIGIEIDSVSDMEAVCSLKLMPQHFNADGGVQGGVIYTLADTTFAIAANSSGNITVTLQGAIRYLNRATGSKLIAKTKLSKMSKKICFYEVEITDELGTAVASTEFTGYIR